MVLFCTERRAALIWLYCSAAKSSQSEASAEYSASSREPISSSWFLPTRLNSGLAPNSMQFSVKHLPIFFIAGGDDPVGSYGKGVLRTEAEFRKAGMVNVTCKLYPGGRHEILNEINRQEVYEDVAKWLDRVLPKKEK